MSGGQRQRIGLARALLGHKRLVILDEATSALASESEARIMRAVDSLRGMVTIVMVAHRLSTLRIADQIGVLDDGKLVAYGRLDELIARGGTFSPLRPEERLAGKGLVRTDRSRWEQRNEQKKQIN